jgi:hypothetical protein
MTGMPLAPAITTGLARNGAIRAVLGVQVPSKERMREERTGLGMTPQEVMPVMRCHPVHGPPKQFRRTATRVPAGRRWWWAWEDLNLRLHPDRKTDRLGIVWPCFHAGTTSPAGTLRLKGESPGVLGGKWFEGDAVAEGVELGDGSLAGAVGVAADEVVATQVLVVTVVGE